MIPPDGAPQEAGLLAAPAAQTRSGVRLRWLLLFFISARTITTTAWRMIYPFLPAIARGLGVDFAAITLAVTLRAGLGLVAPLFGTIGDTRGRRVAMLLGLALFSAAMLLVVIWPTYPALIAALLLSGASKLTFDPAMQAYLGDRVPYQRRGLAMALSELSWSAAFLFGIPIAGWLIARFGWTAPFPVLGLLAAGIWIVLWRSVPPDTPAPGSYPSFLASARTVLAHPAALAALVLGACFSSSNEVVNIIYGVWMEGSFGLQVAALGAASAVIGAAELSGEGLVAALTDRIGKRRSVVLGMVLNAAATLALPHISQSTAAALAGLFLFYLTFEFAIVASLPLVTEVVPGARATMMAGYVAAISAGRMLGAPLGAALFRSGILSNSIASAAITAVGLLMLLLFVRVDQERGR
jgi:predicted MFS family arabinose efflux permease